jgi:4-amino-4-deoxy-L-arabinose transferase-like glycosyltransferase
MHPSRVSTRTTLALLVALALVLRVGAYVQKSHPAYLAGLASPQGEMARSLISGHGFSLNSSEQRLLDRKQQAEGRLVDPAELSSPKGGKWEPQVLEMPGLALLLTPLWAVGADRYAPLQWVQLAIDSALVIAIYWIGWRVTGRKLVGAAAAAAYAVSPAAIVLARTPSMDTWAAFLTVAVTATFVWAREKNDLRRVLLLGIVTGCALYFRPFLILVPIALALATARTWRFLAVPAAVALLMLAPWTVRNWVDFHRFIPTRTGLGLALWEGLAERPNSFGAQNNDEATLEFVHRSRPDLVYGTPAFDSYLLSKARSAIANHPVHYLDLLLRRSIYLLPCLLLLIHRRRLSTERVLFASIAVAVIVPYVFVRMETRYWVIGSFAYFLLAAATLATLVPQSAREPAPAPAP